MLLDEQAGLGMTSQRARDRLVERLLEAGISNNRVLDVIRSTPRHIFLEEALASRAYEDSALPIGQNQTISQPYIVALMTQAAFAGSRTESVLEIGTGCGYQTAVLAQMAKRVCSLERILTLQQIAEVRLRRLGFRNIEYRHGDGFVGWKDRAPFDAIVVTAGAPDIPKMLLAQLSPGGRLVIPVGAEGRQSLVVIRRTGDEWQQETLAPVRFVPLIRGVVG